MRKLLALVWLLLGAAASVLAQVSVGVGVVLPGVSIGIHVPAYPELVPIPGYPVYYAPRLTVNLFFYDGLYWIYQNDYWYVSTWYNGPWDWIDPYVVPIFILRIPVRYYRAPPPYFLGWRHDAPPRWDEHWGREWQEKRGEWKQQWQRGNAPPAAPPPVYQRRYPEPRYPAAEQQQQLRERHYGYQPRDPEVRQQFPPPGQQRGEKRGQEREQNQGPGRNK